MATLVHTAYRTLFGCPPERVKVQFNGARTALLPGAGGAMRTGPGRPVVRILSMGLHARPRPDAGAVRGVARDCGLLSPPAAWGGR